MGAGKWYPGVVILLLLLLNIHKNRQPGRCLNNVCYSWCWVSQPLISVHSVLKSWSTHSQPICSGSGNIPETFHRCCGEDFSGLMNVENYFKQCVSSASKGNRRCWTPFSAFPATFFRVSWLQWFFQVGRGVRIFMEIPCISNNNNNILIFLDFILSNWNCKHFIGL